MKLICMISFTKLSYRLDYFGPIVKLNNIMYNYIDLILCPFQMVLVTGGFFFSYLHLAIVTISRGQVELVGSFKYLGGIMNSTTSLEAEVNTHKGRGLGAFAQFSHLWGNQHLGVLTRVHVFNTFVLPHFVYRAETWNVTQSQQHQLEAAYNN